MMSKQRSLAAEVGPLAAIGLSYWVFHLLFIGRYGYFRDELYYIACSKRLAWGYVDHPPFSIATLALIRKIFGDSLPALRFLPGLAGAASIVMTGVMARTMGAGRRGQILSAVAVCVAPVFLFTTHVYSMNSLDLFFWTLSALIVVGILADAPRQRPRLWLALGVVLGVGLLNKISLLWFGGGLGAGLLLTPHRRMLATRWPWLGAAIAGIIVSPHVLWQVANGWPTLEFMHNATANKMAQVGYAEFLRMQVDALHPFNVPIWAGGFLFCMFGREGRRWRLLGWIFLAVFLLLMVSGKARSNYLAPAFPMMFAAGGVVFERLLTRRWRWALPAYVVVLLVGGAIAAPLVIPVLPVERLIPYSAALGIRPHQEERTRMGPLPQHYADMFGWEELTAAVARIYDGLPPDDKRRCVIFTENYGEAGAIEFFGARYGLPPVVSKHNNYWLWGTRGYAGDVVIAVGGDPEDEKANFEQVTQAGTFDCDYCMPYEKGRPIWLGHHLRKDLGQLWPAMKMYE